MAERKTQLALLALAAACLALAAPAFAHHGNSAYDATREITLAGTVTEFAWSNPHVQLYLDVKDEKGNVAHWSCETVSPGILVRNGWTREELKPGDRVTITVYPAKSGAPVGYLLKIVTAGGKELKLGMGRNQTYHPD